MEFRLFGPVEVWLDGRLVDAGRPGQRVVLAALLAEAGRLVSTEALIDRGWGEAPPRATRRAVHVRLARVRRLFEQDGSLRAPLVRRSGGYLLDVDAQAVDLHRFRRLVDGAGDGPDRARQLRDAVQLWRGEPLAGLPG